MEQIPGFGFVSRPKDRIPHYYGDVIRGILLLAGLILLIAIPFDSALLGLYLVAGVVGVLVLALLAGLTSPTSRLSILSDALVSGLAFMVFEYAAISAYFTTNDFSLFTPEDRIFLLRQLLAILFLLAFYFSTKTLRYMGKLD